MFAAVRRQALCCHFRQTSWMPSRRDINSNRKPGAVLPKHPILNIADTRSCLVLLHHLLIPKPVSLFSVLIWSLADESRYSELSPGVFPRYFYTYIIRRLSGLPTPLFVFRHEFSVLLSSLRFFALVIILCRAVPGCDINISPLFISTSFILCS
jgi:hypothetical protein